MKKNNTNEKHLKRLERMTNSYAVKLEKEHERLEKSADVRLYGNYGNHGAMAADRLLFIINELRGLARDCRPAALETNETT